MPKPKKGPRLGGRLGFAYNERTLETSALAAGGSRDQVLALAPRYAEVLQPCLRGLHLLLGLEACGALGFLLEREHRLAGNRRQSKRRPGQPEARR